MPAVGREPFLFFNIVFSSHLERLLVPGITDDLCCGAFSMELVIMRAEQPSKAFRAPISPGEEGGTSGERHGWETGMSSPKGFPP